MLGGGTVGPGSRRLSPRVWKGTDGCLTSSGGTAEIILVSAFGGDEPAYLRLKKDGTVSGLSAQEPIVQFPSPSIRFLSPSDAKARKLGY